MKFELSPGAKVTSDEDDPYTVNKRSGNARVGLSATRIEGDVKFSGFFDDDRPDEENVNPSTSEEDRYAPENYTAPKETLIGLGDTAATALGVSPEVSPDEKLAAVLAAMESDDFSEEYNPYADNDPRFVGKATTRNASDHDRFAVQGHVEGEVYGSDGEEVDPYSSPNFQVGGGGRERPYTDTLEELRAALKKMEDKGDNSPPVR